MKIYFLNLLIALDQLVNTVCVGYPDETLSARAHRKKWKLEWYIDLLFFWQTDGKYRNHCRSSYDYERARMDLPPEYRECPKCDKDSFV